MVIDYLPSPSQKPEIASFNDKHLKVKPNINEKTLAYVFKVTYKIKDNKS